MYSNTRAGRVLTLPTAKAFLTTVFCIWSFAVVRCCVVSVEGFGRYFRLLGKEGLKLCDVRAMLSMELQI